MDATTLDQGLTSHLLSGYRPQERQAILVHKYYLGIELGSDPGLERAIESWERRYACSWRRERHLADCQAQMQEIDEHRRQLSLRHDREVSWEHAARNWISRYAAKWRARPEL